MAKTKQQGYYKLVPANKWLHFSMNCWVNLKKDSGKDIGTVFSEYDKGDMVDQFSTLCDIAYAALKSYDQEEDNEIDYNIYKVRTWMEELKEEDATDFIAAMTHSINLPGGKKGAKK